MTFQYIHDSVGNPTGIYITIDQWEKLKSKYQGLEKEEQQNDLELSDWEKQLIDERLADYHAHPADVTDFDDMLDRFKKLG